MEAARSFSYVKKQICGCSVQGWMVLAQSSTAQRLLGVGLKVELLDPMGTRTDFTSFTVKSTP